jgi:hypothetical protein
MIDFKTKFFIEVFYHQDGNGIPGHTTRDFRPPLPQRGRGVKLPE